MMHFDWLARHAERTPDKLALVDVDGGLELSYRQFNERANRLASYLVDTLGLRRGDRIAVLAKNSAAYYELYWACGKTGVILAALNWRLAVPELAYLVSDAAPKLLAYDSEFADAAEALQDGYDFEHAMRLIGETAADLTYEQALEVGDPAGVPLPELPYTDTWAILYTSGTTGRPKGAKVTYGNCFYNAVGMGRAMDLTSQDINLTMLPAFHSGGIGLYAFPVWHAGGTIVVMRNFDPEEMLRLIEKWQATVIILVPPMYLMLEQTGLIDKYDVSSIRAWTSGGSPLPVSLVERYQAKGIIIRQGFGMTETGPTVFLITQQDAVRKAGSVGKPVLHTDVCIKDREGNMLGPNEVGELCIRGNITSGYWNNEAATGDAIVDGWLHSGDAAKYDDEGFYYIVDRWKDMYISGGENVYPAEVEQVIYKHEAIAEVAVIGVPHPKWQETGRAIEAL
ncbi:MAG: AMP-binding protein, partial [Anaerolineae bacterium]